MEKVEPTMRAIKLNQTKSPIIPSSHIYSLGENYCFYYYINNSKFLLLKYRSGGRKRDQPTGASLQVRIISLILLAAPFLPSFPGSIGWKELRLGKTLTDSPNSINTTEWVDWTNSEFPWIVLWFQNPMLRFFACHQMRASQPQTPNMQ